MLYNIMLSDIHLRSINVHQRIQNPNGSKQLHAIDESNKKDIIAH